jgi:hypothetical protein
MAGRAPFFTFTREYFGSGILALIKNSRRYEIKIDATFIKDKSPFKDREMLYEILNDLVSGKLETKIYDEVDHTVQVDIMYEQNKKQKVFTITLRDEEYLIAVCLDEAEQKLKPFVEREKKEDKERVVPQINLANIGRSLSKFHSIDLATTNINSQEVVNLMDRMPVSSRWMKSGTYNTFIAWLTYMSYTHRYHYYISSGVTNISNDTCSKATGTVCFYKDSSCWYDYDNDAYPMGYQNYGKPNLVLTNNDAVIIVRKRKAG